MIRDGRDAVLSLYFFKQTRNWKRIKEEVRIDQDEFAHELAIDSRKQHDHLLGWLESLHVFFTSYENLKYNYVKEMKDIVDYIGLPLHKSLEEAEKIFVSDFKPDNDFFRKGIVGDWQNWWDERHKEIFKKNANDMLVMLKYENDDKW